MESEKKGLENELDQNITSDGEEAILKGSGVPWRIGGGKREEEARSQRGQPTSKTGSPKFNLSPPGHYLLKTFISLTNKRGLSWTMKK